MNQKTLEKLARMCKDIQKIIEEDRSGSMCINNNFDKFRDEVMGQLKNSIFSEYQRVNALEI